MVFKYKGLDAKGKKVKGVIEASGLDDAKKRLRAQQIFYTDLSQEKDSSLTRFTFARKKVLTPTELATLSRDLSIYIKSGISIVNALKLAKNQYAKNKRSPTSSPPSSPCSTKGRVSIRRWKPSR